MLGNYREHYVSQELLRRTSCIPRITTKNIMYPRNSWSSSPPSTSPCRGLHLSWLCNAVGMLLSAWTAQAPQVMCAPSPSRLRVHAVLSYACTESLPTPFCRCRISSIERFLDHFCRSRPHRLPCADQTWNGWTPLVRMAFFKLVSLIRPNINTQIPSHFIISQAHGSPVMDYSLYPRIANLEGQKWQRFKGGNTAIYPLYSPSKCYCYHSNYVRFLSHKLTPVHSST